MGLFSFLFKSYSEKQIKKITPIVDSIEALAEEFSKKSDKELREYTDILKGRLAEGETLDDILPEAFALVREADARVLGKRPFRVQLKGGILLHQGRIAEMKTGEGKTLVATLPAYLNALSGKGVHIVTVNDYLATRDSEEMGKVYSFLGLTTGLIVHGQSNSEKRAAYAADITYGTNNELGFDYLRDNMAIYKERLVQRGHNFAIVDEVDSILIDEARTPLIISGNSSKSTDLYKKTSQLVRGMSRHTVKELDTKRDYDFYEDHFLFDEDGRAASLTELGIPAAALFLDLGEEELISDPRFMTYSLTAAAKEKLISSGAFTESDFLAEEESVFFTQSGVSKAEKILNRTFNVKAGENRATLTDTGMKKLIKFFDFTEEHFLYANREKTEFAFSPEGRDFCSKTFFFGDKDFSEENGAYLLTNQGVARCDKALNFDYIVDEKAHTAVLTKLGIEKAERFFGIDNLASPDNGELQHQVNIAIKAYGVMKRDVDYIVKDNAVIIVDAFTGRLMPGRRYNDGLHQAIEAKEGVVIQKETQTVASITFQNYFRMYSKLSGMTGTALTEENEFKEIYALDVVEVPTNRPMIRHDYNDSVYITREAKLKAIINQIKICHEKGQPVLVGTVSVDKSEELSKLLVAAGIEHTVLNAKQHSREAAIVASAGTPGAITISTNMAGRGTDIMLGGNPEYLAKERMRGEGFDEETIAFASGTVESEEEALLSARDLYGRYIEEFKEQIRPAHDAVCEAGGLFIIGTERHESRRIDNQLRGRSGRQGDPGESRFYLSLEDDLMRLFGSDRLLGLAKFGLDENTPLQFGILSSSIAKAQKTREAKNFSIRKHVLSYDDVMNEQRKLIYKQRSEILTEEDIQARIEGMIRESVTSKFEECFTPDGEGSDYDGFISYFRGAVNSEELSRLIKNKFDGFDRNTLYESLIDAAMKLYHAKDSLFAESYPDHPDAMRQVERSILLKNVDLHWMDHLEAMDDLKGYVGLNSYAQRDPVTVYRLESAEMFDRMIEDIREETVKQILTVRPQIQNTERVEVVKATGFGGSASAAPRQPAVSKKKNVSRNDPCPCGSGKKYKNCCWNKDQSNN